MLLERFEENHKKKFDFFYLPIDYNVREGRYRTIATSVTPSSTSSTPNSLRTFTASFIIAPGKSSTPTRSVKSAMQGSREQPNCSTTLSTLTCCSRRRSVIVLWSESSPWRITSKVLWTSRRRDRAVALRARRESRVATNTKNDRVFGLSGLSPKHNISVYRIKIRSLTRGNLNLNCFCFHVLWPS